MVVLPYRTIQTHVKPSKSILSRHAVYLLVIQVVIVVLIALPQLDPYKLQLAQATKAPVSFLWIPPLLLLIVANVLLFRRMRERLVTPNEELVNQTKLGTASIAFKKKSMNAEEDDLKHFIESQVFRSEELELEVSRLENELEHISKISKITPEEHDALLTKLKKAKEEKQAMDEKLQSGEKKIQSFEKENLLLRRELKQKDRELETLQEESREQLLSNNQDPQNTLLVGKLKTPLSLINNLSWRLAKSWAETSPAQIKEGLEEINRHSEEQLELLKRFETEEKT